MPRVVQARITQIGSGTGDPEKSKLRSTSLWTSFLYTVANVTRDGINVTVTESKSGNKLL
jgi:hypothetical protein